MHPPRGDLLTALAGAALLGGFSTLGDWVWARYLTDGAVLPGVVHGALIFLLLAGVLAWSAHTRRAAARLLPSLPAAGVALAAAFYPLARLLGYLGALLAAGLLMWLTTAGLQRWARGGTETASRTLLRAAAAAVGSGLAFWAISGIWTHPAPGGPSYPWHFVCWTFAFVPGLLALLLGHPDPGGEGGGDSAR